MEDKSYTQRPPLPYLLEWDSVPELVRASIADLGGVQPITGEMAKAAAGALRDKPSAAEVEIFRAAGTEFQMISVVASTVAVRKEKDYCRVKPFALTLMPASKQESVSSGSIDYVAAIDVDGWLSTQPSYCPFDPFTGEWGMYGNLGIIGSGKGFLDEVGLVISQFFLATHFDADDVLMVDVGMPRGKLDQKYRRHRADLLFRPFQKPEARRIWGTETPIELFLLQELARHGLHPNIQMLIMEDGGIFPSWYHLWQDLEFRHMPGLITDADIYFPEQRLAVFCDGRQHSRRKQRERDERINARLAALGIGTVRLPAKQIIHDLAAAGEAVRSALAGR